MQGLQQINFTIPATDTIVRGRRLEYVQRKAIVAANRKPYIPTSFLNAQTRLCNDVNCPMLTEKEKQPDVLIAV